jgi:hypothetical protein
MSLGDVQVLDAGAFGEIGSRPFAVALGTTASINAGEPVTKALGATAVVSGVTLSPSVGTTYLAGISATTSNETTTAAGTVQVAACVPGVVYICKADDTTAVDTQTEYNDLVGKRVTFKKTSGVYTVVTSDGGPSNGLIVEPLDIAKYPNMVAFSVRSAANYFA